MGERHDDDELSTGHRRGLYWVRSEAVEEAARRLEATFVERLQGWHARVGVKNNAESTVGP